MLQVELAAAQYFFLTGVKMLILRTHFSIKILKQTFSSVSITNNYPMWYSRIAQSPAAFAHENSNTEHGLLHASLSKIFIQIAHTHST
jgi:hypothetical protein